MKVRKKKRDSKIKTMGMEGIRKDSQMLIKTSSRDTHHRVQAMGRIRDRRMMWMICGQM
jgi:hypothetical protein